MIWILKKKLLKNLVRKTLVWFFLISNEKVDNKSEIQFYDDKFVTKNWNVELFVIEASNKKGM